jgi:hypothetical protein
MIVERTIINKSISLNQNLYNGGYVAYWKIYSQLLQMLSEKNQILANMRKEFSHLFGIELEKKIKRSFFWLKLNAYTWLFVWCCLLKPLGQFFSRKVLIAGSYSVIDSKFVNRNVTKSTKYKFLGIPIWYSTNQKLSEADINDLLK